jgi:hypothetical protein
MGKRRALVGLAALGDPRFVGGWPTAGLWLDDGEPKGIEQTGFAIWPQDTVEKREPRA